MFRKLAALAILSFTLTGCSLVGNPAPTTQTPTPSQANTSTTKAIEIKGFAFSPATITVKAGETITVTNRDSVKHNVAADNTSFGTSLLAKDESATLTAPSKPGTYSFHCTPHPNMKGTLVVE